MSIQVKVTDENRSVYRAGAVITLGKALAESQVMIPADLSKYEQLVLDYVHGKKLRNFFGVPSGKGWPLATQVYYYRDCKAAFQHLAVQYYGILRYHTAADDMYEELLRGRKLSGNMSKDTVYSVHKQILHYERHFELKANGFPKDNVFRMNDIELKEFMSFRYGVRQYLFFDGVEDLQDTIIPTPDCRDATDEIFFTGHCPYFSAAAMRKIGSIPEDFIKMMTENKVLVAY